MPKEQKVSVPAPGKKLPNEAKQNYAGLFWSIVPFNSGRKGHVGASQLYLHNGCINHPFRPLHQSFRSGT